MGTPSSKTQNPGFEGPIPHQCVSVCASTLMLLITNVCFAYPTSLILMLPQMEMMIRHTEFTDPIKDDVSSGGFELWWPIYGAFDLLPANKSGENGENINLIFQNSLFVQFSSYYYFWIHRCLLILYFRALKKVQFVTNKRKCPHLPFCSNLP